MKNLSQEVRVVLAVLVGLLGISLAGTSLVSAIIYSGNYTEYIILGYKGLSAALIITVGFFCFCFSIFFSIMTIVKLLDSRFLLDHVIYPWPMELDELQVDPESKQEGVIIKADDEQIVINYGTRKYPLLFGSILSIIIILPFSNALAKNGYFESSDGIVIASLALSIFAFIYGVFYPKKQFVFNRTTGMATIPGPLYFPPATVPFEKVRPGAVGTAMGFVHTYTGMVSSIGEDYGTDVWSFFVQYMDKNWPLPEGSAFDAYREKDFLRRKSAGFPKPKFRNEIHLNDAVNGYIYGTKEFKEKLTTFKVPFINAYAHVISYICDKENYYPSKVLQNDNDLALVGIYEDYYVFKMYYPQNTEYVLLKELPNDCFLSYGVKKSKKQEESSLVKEHGIAFERREEWLLPEHLRE